MSRLDRNWFQQTTPFGNGLFSLPISQDHFVQRVAQHLPALFEGLPFGEHLGPFEQLPHVAAVDFGVLGSIGLQHAGASLLARRATLPRAITKCSCSRGTPCSTCSCAASRPAVPSPPRGAC